MRRWHSHRVVLWAGVALIAISLAVLPFALAQVGTTWVRITNYAILYVLLALGLNIVVGFAGLLDLGYAAFFAIGAYGYGIAASGHLKPEWSSLWAPLEWAGQVSRLVVPGQPVTGHEPRLPYAGYPARSIGAHAPTLDAAAARTQGRSARSPGRTSAG